MANRVEAGLIGFVSPLRGADANGGAAGRVFPAAGVLDVKLVGVPLELAVDTP